MQDVAGVAELASAPLVSSPQGVLAVLFAVVAFFFFLEQKTRWRFFAFLPPLIFIYATPVLLNNTGVIPQSSPVYGVLGDFALPAFICLMLIGVDVGAAVRVMGRGVGVMLLGTLGIIVGGPIGYFMVRQWLEPDAWKAFGMLAGSWIGGTGNMNAMAAGLDATPEQLGLAVVADNLVYVVWLPILLGSKAFAERFNRWARVDDSRLERMDLAAVEEASEEVVPRMRDYLYLGFVASAAVAVAAWMSPRLPEVQPVLSASMWNVLLVTTIGIALSFTPVRRLPGSHELAMALVYLFVARMGAGAALDNLDQAPAFLLGAFIWIFIHGAFCLVGAYFLRVDIHSVAIASAANVGGAASAPVVAAAHRESLVPASILMALIGYAVGNYGALATAWLCQLVAGI